MLNVLSDSFMLATRMDAFRYPSTPARPGQPETGQPRPATRSRGLLRRMLGRIR